MGVKCGGRSHWAWGAVPLSRSADVDCGPYSVQGPVVSTENIGAVFSAPGTRIQIEEVAVSMPTSHELY